MAMVHYRLWDIYNHEQSQEAAATDKYIEDIRQHHPLRRRYAGPAPNYDNEDLRILPFSRKVFKLGKFNSIM